MASRSRSPRAALQFIETGVDPGTRESVLVLHYADGTSREERFATEERFVKRLQDLERQLRVGRQKLIPFPHPPASAARRRGKPSVH